MEASDANTDEAGNIVKQKFYDFIKESPSAEENDSMLSQQQRIMVDYRAQISHMIQNDKTTLFVNFQSLADFDPELMEGMTSINLHISHCFAHLITSIQLLKWNIIDLNLTYVKHYKNT